MYSIVPYLMSNSVLCYQQDSLTLWPTAAAAVVAVAAVAAIPHGLPPLALGRQPTAHALPAFLAAGGGRATAYGSWLMVEGLCPKTQDLWPKAHGRRLEAYGLLQAYGLWPVAYGFWRMARGWRRIVSCRPMAYGL